MVVFSFGDRNGKAYDTQYVIDHLDENHKNNKVSNLELVYDEINLWRAAKRHPNSPKTKQRFLDKYNSLSGEKKNLIDDIIKEEGKTFLKEINKPQQTFNTTGGLVDIIFASGNQGKLDELSKDFEAYGINLFRI